MKEKILRDLKNLSMRLKYETSENRIAIYLTNYIALSSLLNLLDMKDVILPLDFDFDKLLEIFNKKVKKDKVRYFNQIMSTIPINYEQSAHVLDAFDESDFYPYSTRLVPGIDMGRSAEYLIDFMDSMGRDVFKIFSSIYDEDRIDYFRSGTINGLCTSASTLNSCYITYAPKLDYFDSSIVSHEIGHAVQERLMYEHGLFTLTGTIYDEVISQYFELCYIDFIKKIDKNIFEVESSTLRTYYKNAMDMYITPILINIGALYKTGVDLRSYIPNVLGIEGFFEEKDIPIINGNLKEYSYSKSATYFIGMLIAEHFVNLYSENRMLGLRKLKEFISVAHTLPYEKQIELLGIDNEHTGLKNRIKENKDVLKWTL